MHHDRALEHPDEQKFAAGVVGVDLRREFRDPGLQPLGGDQHLLEVGAHVSRVHPRPPPRSGPGGFSLPRRRAASHTGAGRGSPRAGRPRAARASRSPARPAPRRAGAQRAARAARRERRRAQQPPPDRCRQQVQPFNIQNGSKLRRSPHPGVRRRVRGWHGGHPMLPRHRAAARATARTARGAGWRHPGPTEDVAGHPPAPSRRTARIPRRRPSPSPSQAGACHPRAYNRPAITRSRRPRVRGRGARPQAPAIPGPGRMAPAIPAPALAGRCATPRRRRSRPGRRSPRAAGRRCARAPRRRPGRAPLQRGQRLVPDPGPGVRRIEVVRVVPRLAAAAPRRPAQHGPPDRPSSGRQQPAARAGIPASDRAPEPRARPSSTVSAWSSRVWPSSTAAAPGRLRHLAPAPRTGRPARPPPARRGPAAAP